MSPDGGSTPQKPLGLGVAIVTYRSADFIADCLESLLAARQPGLKVVIVDNASPDQTVEAIRAWAAGSAPHLRADWPFEPEHRAPRPIAFTELADDAPTPACLPQITLLRGNANLGYAGAVNRAIRALQADSAIDLFWVLNPDTVVEPQTPSALVRAATTCGRFAVMGGRTVFFDRPDTIQIDGGRLGRFTARVSSVNFGTSSATPLPTGTSLDFITGASMVASRDFLAAAGLMEERYFLYFEEIDWQLRRGSLPLVVAPDAVVRHRAGITIGSGGAGKPSAFAVYFTYRNLPRFVRRWFPWRMPGAYVLSWLRALRHSDGTRAQFAAFIAGLHGLPPPSAVRARLPQEDWQLIDQLMDRQ